MTTEITREALQAALDELADAHLAYDQAVAATAEAEEEKATLLKDWQTRHADRLSAVSDAKGKRDLLDQTVRDILVEYHSEGGEFDEALAEQASVNRRKSFDYDEALVIEALRTNAPYLLKTSIDKTAMNALIHGLVERGPNPFTGEIGWRLPASLAWLPVSVEEVATPVVQAKRLLDIARERDFNARRAAEQAAADLDDTEGDSPDQAPTEVPDGVPYIPEPEPDTVPKRGSREEARYVLERELIEINTITHTVKSGGLNVWEGRGFFEGVPLKINFYPEDRRALRDAGYDVEGWTNCRDLHVTLSVMLRWTKRGWAMKGFYNRENKYQEVHA